MRFNGLAWKLFGDVIAGEVGATSAANSQRVGPSPR
jgi:hypothetical protein